MCLCLIKIFILIICITVSLGSYHTWKSVNQRLLEDIKLIMNVKANPCNDFYQYACGHWDRKLPFKREYKDTIGSLEYKTNLKLKNKLKEKYFQQHMEKDIVYLKVGTYYETCLQQQTFNVNEYLEVVKPGIKQKWPNEGEYTLPTEPWNIWSVLAKMQAIGLNGFLFTMELKRYNSTQFYIYLSEMENLAFTGYEQRLFDDMDYLDDVEAYVLYEKIENCLKRLFLLNKRHQKSAHNYRDITAVELQNLITNIDFKTFFSTLWDSDYVNNLPLKVANLDYFHDLAILIQQTDIVVLMHSLKLRFLFYMKNQMPSTSDGLKCLQHMRDLKPLALDYLYEQEFYQPLRNTSNRLIYKIFKNMKQKFFSIITEHSPEFSLEEINFLKRKLDLMKLNIGNMPKVSNNSFYQQYFKSWQVFKDQFYLNHINALQHFYAEKFNLIKKPWSNPLHTYIHWPFASPAYQPTSNLLIIPYAYLQYPIFHTKFHKLFLYAELGNTLGHEMLHAFDTNGLQYDGLGNPSAVFIKSLPDKKSLMTSLECLNRCKPFSLNEMIADISGFRLAYDLYFKNSSKVSGVVSLSDKQLFFIKFAQFFCSAKPNYDAAHDSPSYRVRKVVNSHPEFENIFKCHPDSYKRELEKCHLW